MQLMNSINKRSWHSCFHGVLGILTQSFTSWKQFPTLETVSTLTLFHLHIARCDPSRNSLPKWSVLYLSTLEKWKSPPEPCPEVWVISADRWAWPQKLLQLSSNRLGISQISAKTSDQCKPTRSAKGSRSKQITFKVEDNATTGCFFSLVPP